MTQAAERRHGDADAAGAGPPRVLEVRIHGRGGQGNVAAAYLLAGAAIRDGDFAQAFPAFGAERRGAPVAAFVRIADRTLRRRAQVRQPHFLIIQDRTLLAVPGTLDGLAPGGGVLVNIEETSEALADRLGVAAVALPADAMSREALGRPVPNTALLAAFSALTGAIRREALEEEVRSRFESKGSKVVDGNLALIDRACGVVPAGLWKEVADAAGT